METADILYITSQNQVEEITTTKHYKVLFGPGVFEISRLVLSPFVKSLQGTKGQTTLILSSDEESILVGQGQSLKNLYIKIISPKQGQNHIKGFGGCINKIENVKVYVKNSNGKVFKDCNNFENLMISASDTINLNTFSEATVFEDCERIRSISFRGLFKTFFKDSYVVSDITARADVSAHRLIYSVLADNSQISNSFVSLSLKATKGSTFLLSEGKDLTSNLVSQISIDYI